MKYFRLIGILSLLVFSFYLTDFITELAINSNPLMQSIKNNSNIYYVDFVNASIDGNTIIPGIKGKRVNEMESFLNMKDFGSFNINYLIYDDVIPEVSIQNNKDKVIISGNTMNRYVSILVKNNDIIMKYLKDNNIKYSKLITMNSELDVNENINIENESSNFKDLDTLLKRKELNKKICIINYSNINECKKNNYYVVKPNVLLKNSSIFNEINNIKNGNIVLIDDNLELDNFKLYISKLQNMDIEIVYLSKIIEE